MRGGWPVPNPQPLPATLPRLIAVRIADACGAVAWRWRDVRNAVVYGGELRRLELDAALGPLGRHRLLHHYPGLWQHNRPPAHLRHLARHETATSWGDLAIGRYLSSYAITEFERALTVLDTLCLERAATAAGVAWARQQCESAVPDAATVALETWSCQVSGSGAPWSLDGSASGVSALLVYGRWTPTELAEHWGSLPARVRWEVSAAYKDAHAGYLRQLFAFAPPGRWLARAVGDGELYGLTYGELAPQRVNLVPDCWLEGHLWERARAASDDAPPAPSDGTTPTVHDGITPTVHTDVHRCESCNRMRPLHTAEQPIDGAWLCAECLDACPPDERYCCESCHLWPHVDDTVETQNGDLMCVGCARLYCDECGNCGDLVYRSGIRPVSVEGGDTDRWCQSCAERDAVYCAECGRIAALDAVECDDENGDYYCCNCQETASARSYRRLVHTWNYRPDLVFHSENGDRGRGVYYFGFELEMEFPPGSNLSEPARAVLDALPEDLAYVKEDGSLQDGFEIVTHPLSWRWWQQHKKELDPVFDLARTHGARSYYSGRCGLHVHVSRTAFRGAGLHDYKFSQLFLDQRFALRVSRRDEGDLHQWAAPRNRSSYSLARICKDKIRDSSRYMSINLTNGSTYEVRIFRGTMRKSSVYACLELVHAAYEWSAAASVSDRAQNFAAWTMGAGRHDHPNAATLLQRWYNREER